MLVRSSTGNNATVTQMISLVLVLATIEPYRYDMRVEVEVIEFKLIWMVLARVYAKRPARLEERRQMHRESKVLITVGSPVPQTQTPIHLRTLHSSSRAAMNLLLFSEHTNALQ